MKRIVLLVAAVVSLASISSVFAHAEPATAKPGDGAVLTTPPTQVVLVMSQDMARTADANDIDVFDASGKEVTTAQAVVDNADRKKLTVALPATIGPGTYKVAWKTLSADDGDPANGSISFTYNPTGTPSAGTEQLKPDLLGGDDTPAPESAAVDISGSSSSDGVTWVLVVAVGVAALVLGAGGTFFLVQRPK
jgi:methionine-rich copper-binding protein CopC